MKRMRQYRIVKTSLSTAAQAQYTKLNTKRARLKQRTLASLRVQPNTQFYVVSALRRRLLRRIARRASIAAPSRTPHNRLDIQLQYAALRSSTHRVSKEMFSLKSTAPLLAFRAKSRTYRAAKLSKVRKTLMYTRLQFQRAAHRLQTQRAFRSGSTVLSTPKLVAHRSYAAAARLILHARGDHLSYGGPRVFGSSSARNRLTFKARLRIKSAVAVVPGPVNAVQESYLSTRTIYTKRPSAPMYSFGFLQRSAFQMRTQKSSAAEMLGEALLLQKRRRYRASQIVHRRPKMRLPNVEITRARRRKSGHVTFIANMLKRPKTLVGRQRQLLPPINSYNVVAKAYGRGQAFDVNALRAYEHREETLPIF